MNENESFSLKDQSLEERLKEMVADSACGFGGKYNLVVLGRDSLLNSIEWSSFSPELFLSSSISPENNMLLNSLLDFLCWEMDSRYSTMEMMRGVNHIEDLISPPIPYLIIFEDFKSIYQFPLVWDKLKRLLRNGRGVGLQTFVAVD